MLIHEMIWNCGMKRMRVIVAVFQPYLSIGEKGLKKIQAWTGTRFVSICSCNTCHKLTSYISRIISIIYGFSIDNLTTSSQLEWELNWWDTAPASRRSGFECHLAFTETMRKNETPGYRLSLKSIKTTFRAFFWILRQRTIPRRWDKVRNFSFFFDWIWSFAWKHRLRNPDLPNTKHIPKRDHSLGNFAFFCVNFPN